MPSGQGISVKKFVLTYNLIFRNFLDLEDLYTASLIPSEYPNSNE